MERRLSSMLLGGAMIAAMAAPLMAQVVQAATAQPKYPLDIAVTYSAMRSNIVTGGSFWMQGGSVQVHAQFYRGFGVVEDVAGVHTGNMSSTGVELDLVTATFGPRYTWSPPHRKYAFFGQAMVGEAFGFNSAFPATSGATDSDDGLALKIGGGMNVALSPRVALRTFETDWLHAQLPNSTTNVQNTFQLSTGLVFRFH